MTFLTSAWVERFGTRCFLHGWFTVTWSKAASSTAMGSEQGKGSGDLQHSESKWDSSISHSRQTEPIKGRSSDGWYMSWWVEIWLHKFYGSLGKEMTDRQKHLQNEKLSKLCLHTFSKYLGRAMLDLKHLGYYAPCQTSSQGLALSSLRDFLQRTMNYNSKRHWEAVLSSVFLHFSAVKNGQI